MCGLFFHMEEFTAIDSADNGYKWRYRFYKKSLQQYKMVVTRTRHNSTQGFELYYGLSRASHSALLWVEPCPPPNQLHVKYMVGDESNTICHLLPHTIYGAACSFATCSFCAQLQYQTLLSVFFRATAPSRNYTINILVER